MRVVYALFDTLNRQSLECYGGTSVRTPNFNRLAAQTVAFDNHYVGSLPCMPARREMMTGRHNFLHRSWGPCEPFDHAFQTGQLGRHLLELQLGQPFMRFNLQTRCAGKGRGHLATLTCHRPTPVQQAIPATRAFLPRSGNLPPKPAATAPPAPGPTRTPDPDQAGGSLRGH